MNQISIIPHIIDKGLEITIFIDGELFDLPSKKGLINDIYYIYEALEVDGTYECPVFTCSCGIAECAAIQMKASANDDFIAWRMTHPLKFSFIFKRTDYFNAIADFQKGLNHLLNAQHVKNDLTPKYKKWLLEPFVW